MVHLVLRAVLVVRVSCVALVVGLVLRGLGVLRCEGGVRVGPLSSTTSSPLALSFV